MSSEDGASLHSVADTLALSERQSPEIDNLDTGKVGNRDAPISMMIENPYEFYQTTQSLKGEESLPVLESPIVGFDIDLKPGISFNYQEDGPPIGIREEYNFGVNSLSGRKREGETVFQADGNILISRATSVEIQTLYCLLLW